MGSRESETDLDPEVTTYRAPQTSPEVAQDTDLDTIVRTYRAAQTSPVLRSEVAQDTDLDTLVRTDRAAQTSPVLRSEVTQDTDLDTIVRTDRAAQTSPVLRSEVAADASPHPLKLVTWTPQPADRPIGQVSPFNPQPDNSSGSGGRPRDQPVDFGAYYLPGSDVTSSVIPNLPLFQDFASSGGSDSSSGSSPVGGQAGLSSGTQESFDNEEGTIYMPQNPGNVPLLPLLLRTPSNSGSDSDGSSIDIHADQSMCCASGVTSTSSSIPNSGYRHQTSCVQVEDVGRSTPATREPQQGRQEFVPDDAEEPNDKIEPNACDPSTISSLIPEPSTTAAEIALDVSADQDTPVEGNAPPGEHEETPPQAAASNTITRYQDGRRRVKSCGDKADPSSEPITREPRQISPNPDNGSSESGAPTEGSGGENAAQNQAAATSDLEPVRREIGAEGNADDQEPVRREIGAEGNADDEEPVRREIGAEGNVDDQEPVRREIGAEGNADDEEPVRREIGAEGNVDHQEPVRREIGAEGNVDDQEPVRRDIGAEGNADDQEPRKIGAEGNADDQEPVRWEIGNADDQEDVAEEAEDLENVARPERHNLENNAASRVRMGFGVALDLANTMFKSFR